MQVIQREYRKSHVNQTRIVHASIHPSSAIKHATCLSDRNWPTSKARYYQLFHISTRRSEAIPCIGRKVMIWNVVMGMGIRLTTYPNLSGINLPSLLISWLEFCIGQTAIDHGQNPASVFVGGQVRTSVLSRSY